MLCMQPEPTHEHTLFCTVLHVPTKLCYFFLSPVLVTVRLIRSFEHRNIRFMVLHGVKSTTLVEELEETIDKGIQYTVTLLLCVCLIMGIMVCYVQNCKEFHFLLLSRSINMVCVCVCCDVDCLHVQCF